MKRYLPSGFDDNSFLIYLSSKEIVNCIVLNTAIVMQR